MRIQLEVVYCCIFILVFYRGQESAGIVTSVGNDAKHFNVKKGMGLISGTFNDDAMKLLKGKNYFIELTDCII